MDNGSTPHVWIFLLYDITCTPNLKYQLNNYSPKTSKLGAFIRFKVEKKYETYNLYFHDLYQNFEKFCIKKIYVIYLKYLEAAFLSQVRDHAVSRITIGKLSHVTLLLIINPPSWIERLENFRFTQKIMFKILQPS